MFKTEKKCQNLDDFLFFHELKWESETKCLIIASPGNLHCIKVLGVRFSNPVKKLPSFMWPLARISAAVD